jgi:hypothetical protein
MIVSGMDYFCEWNNNRETKICNNCRHGVRTKAKLRPSDIPIHHELAMSVAIGTISAASGSSHATSAVASQAQLDRCVNQLGDWTSCSSGKTPEGQQIIAALEQKIGSLKAQIQSVANNTGSSTSSNASTAAQANTTTASPPTSLSLASIGNLGTLLNTVA